jgi:sugar lactone lactonase YvrE/uncharacterized protein YjdB
MSLDPNLRNFGDIYKKVGDPAFTITPPQSDSAGSFSYTSSNTSVATISGSTVTIVGLGRITITATQEASDNYLSSSITTKLIVYKQDIFINSGLNSPVGLAFDSSGNLYCSNYAGNSITKITPQGGTSTFINSGLNRPAGLAFDSSGNLYCANFLGNSITRITPQGETSTFINSGLSVPVGLAFDSSGNLYCANSNGNSITKITPQGGTSTFINSGLNRPFGLAFDSSGNLYCSNNFGNSITRITPQGGTSTFINSGLNYPHGLAFDSYGDLYCANYSGNSITKITPQGGTSTFINSGLNGPNDLAFDSSGNLYCANNNGNSITKILLSRMNPNLRIFSIPTKTFGDLSFNITDPSSNSDGSFNYTSSNPLVADISGSTITIKGAGQTTITAIQSATTNYLDASINTVFTVLKAPTTLTNFSIDQKTYGDTSFNIIDPSSNSDGSFNYTSSNPLVATIDGSNVTIISPGQTLITATQIATNNYLTGSVDASFTVLKANPNLRNFSIDTKTFGQTPFNITDPSSNSDGSFNYTSSNPLVATIDGSNVTIVGAGETLITATQIATANYLQGSIDASFVVLHP